jgi:hypothetical protein
MLSYYAGSLFVVWMAIESVRRGHANPWLWIILFTPPFGAIVFLAVILIPQGLPRFQLGLGGPSAHDLRQAATEVKRLDNCAAWTDYARALRARKKYSEAVVAGRSAVEREDSELEGHYQLGLALLENAQPELAIEPLGRVIATDEDHDSGEALFCLADAYAKTGDSENARRSLEALVDRRARPRFLYSLALLSEGMGDVLAARRHLERIIDDEQYVPNVLKRDIRPWVRQARKRLKKLPAA